MSTRRLKTRYKVVKDFARKHPDTEIQLPTRATEHSAGNDFYMPCDLEIPPFERTLIFTDVKCNLYDDEFLMLVPRSSTGIKKGIMLSNTIGVVDSDYYENEDNDGNIALALFNTSALPVKLEKGERVAQGIIMKFMETSHRTPLAKRVGGMGSTGV